MRYAMCRETFFLGKKEFNWVERGDKVNVNREKKFFQKNNRDMWININALVGFEPQLSWEIFHFQNSTLRSFS